MEKAAAPVTSFGVIADVQYADVDDGFNYSKTSKRFYRRSLEILKDAVNSWNNNNIRHVFQLGDVIDGKAKQNQKSEETLKQITDVCDTLDGQFFHIWGNHEFYNFPRSWLMDSPICSARQPNCISPGNGVAYYYKDLCDKLRIVVLDTYELSVIGSDKGSEEYQQQYAGLRSRNRNDDMNSCSGMHGTSRRFVMYNGGCSEAQLTWLDQVIAESRERKQNVIVMSHCSVYEGSCDVSCLCWNHNDVMKVLTNHKDSVLCYFAGHDHVGGYAQDDSGIHHITMPGVVETQEVDCYATVNMYNSVLEIKGGGAIQSHSIPLKYPYVI